MLKREASLLWAQASPQGVGGQASLGTESLTLNEQTACTALRARTTLPWGRGRDSIQEGGALVFPLWKNALHPQTGLLSCPIESGLSATLYFGGSLAEIISCNTASPINLAPSPCTWTTCPCLISISLIL